MKAQRDRPETEEVSDPALDAAVDAFLRSSFEGWNESLVGIREVLAEVVRCALRASE